MKGLGWPTFGTVDNAGWVVEVHQSSIRPALFYRIGRLDENHGITWGSSHEFDAGQQPTIRFLDLDENQLVERHLGAIDSSQDWTWTAQIDREAWTIEFDQRNTTEEKRWADESASADIGQIKVWAGPDKTSGSDTLQYESDSGFNGRIRYSQMAFMEIQASFDSALLQESTPFFAAPSGESESAKNWANLGWQTRIWGFSDTDLDEAIPHFPSTDTPFADWYIQMCQERNTPQ